MELPLDEITLKLDEMAQAHHEVSEKNPKGSGRHVVPINWRQVAYLYSIMCTHKEVASFLQLSYDTLINRCLKEHGIPLSKFRDIFREGGKASLRRKQWVLADKNANMAIFLGKQYLGQEDGYDFAHNSKVQIEVVNYGKKFLEKWENEAEPAFPEPSQEESEEFERSADEEDSDTEL